MALTMVLDCKQPIPKLLEHMMVKNKLLVHGLEKELNGEVVISGAKNSVLPLMCASLLTEEKLVLRNVPNLLDVNTMIELLKAMGGKVENNLAQNEITIQCAKIDNVEAPQGLARDMRASILALGPMLARAGKIRISYPGGCSIGARPIEVHLDGVKALGATCRWEGETLVAECEELKGAEITLAVPSVTGTETLVMAATLAKGKTIIHNVAMEPEISDLVQCLNKMGAKIYGDGTPTLEIHGVESLKGCEYEVVPDRIEAGTFLCAVAMTGGKVMLRKVNPKHLEIVLDKLVEAGALIECGDDWILVEIHEKPKAVDVDTRPYPGFPTDMQAQFMAMNVIAKGEGKVTENIFENRFMHVEQLKKLGADIAIDGSTATVKGVEKLKGATVKATDLRASASLIMAGLVAEGVTSVTNIHHLDRGYEKIEIKFAGLGAKIERVPDEEA